MNQKPDVDGKTGVVNLVIDITKEEKNKRNKYIYSCIFLTTFLDYFSTLIEFILTYSMGDHYYHKFQLKPIQLIFVCLLCYYFLKDDLYCHHLVSIIIICLSVIIITYTSFQSIEWYLIIYFGSFLCFSIKQIIEKDLMRKYLTPYKILFFEGSIGLIASCIMLSIFSNIKCPEFITYCTQKYFDDPVQLFKNINYKGIFFLFGIDLLSISGINICIFQINYTYSPTHIIISDVIVSIVDWVIMLITGSKETVDTVLQSIGYALLVLSCLIYNEIIVIGICGLNKNIKKEIQQRADDNFKNVHYISFLSNKSALSE